MADPTHLSAFLPMVLPNVPDCPEWVAIDNVRLAAIEFCEKTRCWRHVVSQTLTAQEPTVILPSYATLHEIEFATLEEGSTATPLTPIAFTDAHGKGWDLGATPEYITQQSDGSLIVLPFLPPEAVNVMLTVSAFLKPKHGRAWESVDGQTLEAHSYVPEMVFTSHGEAIAWGALSRILMLKQWLNPAQAAYYLSRFRERLETQSSASIRGQQRANLRSRTEWC